MNAGIIYTRVSTKEQAEKRLSLENQEKECKDFARKQEVIVPENNIFSDRGESAKVIDRTELQRMLRFVQDNRGKIEVLYIWKIDRLARNLGDYYGIKVALAKYGVKIISVTEPIDDDPVGRFLEAILAAAAQFDNEIRAIRSLTGMKMRVEQGEWPHSTTIGYKKLHRSVVIDPEYADAVRDLLIKFSSGLYSVADMSRFAFEKGIKTKSGKPKSHEAMKKLLKNLFYAGYTNNKLSDKIIKGRHTPLVDEQVIYKNIDILNMNKKTIVITGDDLYPLRGTLLCTNCKLFLGASTPRGNGGHYAYYHCPRKTCTKKITGKKTTADLDIVHKHFRELLEARRPLNKGITKLYKTLVMKAWNDEYGKALETKRRITSETQTYQELRHSTNEKFIADKISEEDKDEQLRRIDEKIYLLEQEKIEMDGYVKEKEQIVDDAMIFIEAPDLFWNRASTRSRRAVQRLLFPSGIPYDFETGFGTMDLIETYLLMAKISNKKANNSDLVAASGLEPLTSGL